jgi:hypothetical protein
MFLSIIMSIKSVARGYFAALIIATSLTGLFTFVVLNGGFSGPF